MNKLVTSNKTLSNHKTLKFVFIRVGNSSAKFLDCGHWMKGIHYILNKCQLFRQFSSRLGRIFIKKLNQPIFIQLNKAIKAFFVIKSKLLFLKRENHHWAILLNVTYSPYTTQISSLALTTFVFFSSWAK